MQSLDIVFTGQNQLELISKDIGAPTAHQVTVRNRFSLISTGTESICLLRLFAPGTHWDNWIKYPFSPGYLSAGEVVEVGSEVKSLKVGDRVACRIPHRQRFNLGANEALPIPEGVSDRDAAWFGLATITQNGVRKAQHKLGDRVVIIGLGLLGQLVTQYVRLLGAREIIAIDTSAMRLEMALAHGATHAISKPVAQAREDVMAATQNLGADVVYDITGHPDVLNSALGLVRRFGTLVLLGDTGTPSDQRLSSALITNALTIVGAHDVDAPPSQTPWTLWSKPEMARLFFNYLERGQMRVDDLVTHTFSPLDARRAYDQLQTDRAQMMGAGFDWAQLDS